MLGRCRNFTTGINNCSLKWYGDGTAVWCMPSVLEENMISCLMYFINFWPYWDFLFKFWHYWQDSIIVFLRVTPLTSVLRMHVHWRGNSSHLSVVLGSEKHKVKRNSAVYWCEQNQFTQTSIEYNPAYSKVEFCSKFSINLSGMSSMWRLPPTLSGWTAI